MTDNIDDLLEQSQDIKPLTQEEVLRAVKLDGAIAILTAELKGYKDRAGATLSVGKHGVIKVSERIDKDLEATAEKFPYSEYPEKYKYVLDTDAIAPKDFVKKPGIPVVSFKG